MLLLYIYVIKVFVQSAHFYSLNNFYGWNYINSHCRDNNNIPVDWWYIYKPPSDVGPYLDSGRNFSFITPDTGGRWQPSDRYITANSMLQHTLSPLFRPTYADYLAVVEYAEKEEDGTFPGSTALGIMIADEMGGLWIGHTVPGFPDLTRDRPTFPENELLSGHLIMCMSLDLATLNKVAVALRAISPRIIHLKIAPAIESSLPDWKYMAVKKLTLSRKSPIEFLTRNKTLRAIMMVRQPGGNRCLYRTFARNMHIVLDVYRHDSRRKPTCNKGFSVRNINSISLKYPEKVLYIDKKTDRIGFAVSTAAHWQRRASRSRAQYWTCTSNLEKEDSSTKGGFILCVEDYNVWSSFDNLKIKEPEC